MTDIFSDLEITNRALAAPMAGGATTIDMVVAAAGAGSFGQIAAGYKGVDELRAQIAATRALTPRFGVNLFAPTLVPISEADYGNFAARVATEGDAHGVDVRAIARRDDDDYRHEKIALLVADPAPLVSFTFGLPDPESAPSPRSPRTPYSAACTPGRSVA